MRLYDQSQAILVVAAHPDDEVLGCGATVSRLVAEGNKVSIVILGEGATSRVDTRSDANFAETDVLETQAKRAAMVLGVDDVTVFDFPDNRLDTVALLDITKIIEQAIERVQPSVVFCHHSGDLNVDHGVVNRAVLTATRAMEDSCVRDVVAFEIASSTEWAMGRIEPAFRPNMWVDVSEYLQKKIEALASYEGELREFPHPRSTKNLEALATYRGAQSGLVAAEAFEVLRSVRP